MHAVVSPAASPPRRPRALATAFLAGLALIWVWVLLTSTGSTDRAVLVTEVAGAAALALAAVHAPTPQGRRVVGLVGGWAALSALGDSWWLLTAGSPAVSYARGQYEPTSTVVVFLLRYAALAVALALAVPHRTGAPRGAWSALGDALAPLQVAGGAAALVALTTPLGDLLDDGHPYSLFFACDLLVAAGAASLVLRRALAVRRVPGHPARLAVATAVGVACLCAADAGVVLGLVRGSPTAGALGYTCGLVGAAVVVVAHLRAGRVPAPAGSCLPPVPVAGRGTRLAALLAARLLLPAAVLVLTTAGAVLGSTGTSTGTGAGSGAGWPAALGGDRPVTTGLAVTALAFALADAVLRLVRADRAETTAASAVTTTAVTSTATCGPSSTRPCAGRPRKVSSSPSSPDWSGGRAAACSSTPSAARPSSAQAAATPAATRRPARPGTSQPGRPASTSPHTTTSAHVPASSTCGTGTSAHSSPTRRPTGTSWPASSA
ncbi:hypothetical protein GTQ99_00040 [Kineococcus sp. T13]|uniref:hypothetical protein n=1 Tax=Kineococcus vitellinus TaxID=2696565 RepID=UPI001411E80F|nr:hypothetical protein [Kineococcus vitellinus]NAZ73821.1 hypothetical protein [Kineococcus vitellinus]